MKKAISLVSLAALTIGLLGSCSKIDERISNLETRVNGIENTSIASVQQQIDGVKASITKLEDADEDINGKIMEFKTTAEAQQKLIDALKETDKALGQKYGELEARIDSLEGQVSAINVQIVALEEADKAIHIRIDELKSYVDTELGKTKDWAAETFATLDQYQKTADDLAALSVTVKGIGTTLDGVQTTIAGLDTKIDGIDAALQEKITAAKTELEEKITSLKTDLEGKIAGAVSASETSIKSWINELLKGYYTIAQVDAKIGALNTAIEASKSIAKERIDSVARELTVLKTAVDTAKTAIRTEYKNAITTAINKYNGEICKTLKDSIIAVNGRIDALGTRVTNLEGRVQTMEVKVDILENLIQSIVFIPEYQGDMIVANADDGKFKDLVLDFRVSPAKTVDTLLKYKNHIAVEYKSVKVLTKAAPEASLIIKSVEKKNGKEDVITVTIESKELDNISKTLLSENESIALCLHFIAAGNDVLSDYTSVLVNNHITPSIKDFAQEFIGVLDVWKQTRNSNGNYVPSNWSMELDNKDYDKSKAFDIALQSMNMLVNGGTMSDKIPEAHNHTWAISPYREDETFQNAAVDLTFIRNAGNRQTNFAASPDNIWANYVSYTNDTEKGEPSVKGYGYEGFCCLERHFLIMARFFKYLLDNNIESSIQTGCSSMMLSASLYSEPVTIEDFARSFVGILDVWESTVTTGKTVGDKDLLVNIKGHFIPDDTRIVFCNRTFGKSGMYELACKSLSLLLGKGGSLLIPIPTTSGYSWAFSPYFENPAFKHEEVNIDFLQNFANRQGTYAKNNNIYANFCSYSGSSTTSGTPVVYDYSGDCCIERNLLMMARFYKYILDNNITKDFKTALDGVTFSADLY